MFSETHFQDTPTMHGLNHVSASDVQRAVLFQTQENTPVLQLFKAVADAPQSHVLERNTFRFGMTCQESAGSFQSLQNGLPDTTTGVPTDSCCYQGIYNCLCPHNCCSGKTNSYADCAGGGMAWCHLT